MQIVNEMNEDQAAFWPDGELLVMLAPEGMANCTSCSAIRTVDPETVRAVIRVAWKPSAEDVVALQNGGTIWLSCWGGLPPHSLIVQPRG